MIISHIIATHAKNNTKKKTKKLGGQLYGYDNDTRHFCLVLACDAFVVLQLATGETVLTILCDQFPVTLGGSRRILVTGVMCLVALLMSFGLLTQVLIRHVTSSKYELRNIA